MFRHMFLYFAYPTFYEPICSKDHKRQIYSAFSDRISGGEDPYKLNASPTSLDQSICQIRAALRAEHNTENLDFYQEPFESRCREKPTTPPKGQKVIPPTPEVVDGPPKIEEVFLDPEEVQHILSVWQRKKNLILQGPPGVGKTFAARRLANALMEADASNFIEFIQFHQSYSYEDFIQGYRPTDDGFRLKNGSFHNFCRRAQSNPHVEHVFIIDEINRGNLSKIFGETMMLIEADKRGPGFGISLPYGDGGDKFFVPENVYLLGLMNTADRSLALVDYALPRRFGFHELVPKFDSEKFHAHLDGMGITDDLIGLIKERIGRLNEEIAGDKANLGRGYCIGHSCFCASRDKALSEQEWYRQIINTEVIPLLEEYWFDAPSKVEEWSERLLSGF